MARYSISPSSCDEAGEPGILHAAALLGGDGMQDPLGEHGVFGKGHLIGGGDHPAQQVHAPGPTGPREKFPRDPGEGAFEVQCVEALRQGVQQRGAEFVDAALIRQYRAQLTLAPDGRRRLAGDDGELPVVERPGRTRPDHGRAEADRGDVALADRAQADRDAQLPGVQPALVGVRDCARVAQRGGLGGVLRRERGPQDDRPFRAQLGVATHVGRDGRGVPNE